MEQFLRCSYGTARIVAEKPRQAAYLGTVAVNDRQRYRVLREGRELYAVRIEQMS